MLKTAVILAAGMGSRLKDLTNHQPKGMLIVDGVSLIQRSINNLLKSGVKNIYIGTGYQSEVYEKFALGYPEITCVRSDKFEITSSMYTLYNMRAHIRESFLLLESDLLYEPNALSELINDKKEDIVLASGKTYSNDEVFIQTDNNSFLEKMSKNPSDLRTLDAELVGISKISIERFEMMCESFQKSGNDKIDYEYIMVDTSISKPFYVKIIPELIWCEIDDKNHLNRALKKIVPRLKEKAKYE